MSGQDDKARARDLSGARDYTVTDRTDLHFDGAVYRPGDTVALPDEIAAPLLADGIVFERKAAIRAAYKGLDPDNPDLRTADGKAKVEALEATLGFDISAAERDEAHAAIEAAGKDKA